MSRPASSGVKCCVANKKNIFGQPTKSSTMCIYSSTDNVFDVVSPSWWTQSQIAQKKKTFCKSVNKIYQKMFTFIKTHNPQTVTLQCTCSPSYPVPQSISFMSLPSIAEKRKHNILFTSVPEYVHLCVVCHCQVCLLCCHDLVDEFKTCIVQEHNNNNIL